MGPLLFEGCPEREPKTSWRVLDMTETLRLYDFNDSKRLIRTYGGNAGRKISVVGPDGEPWMVKFPEPTRGMSGNIASYTTSPISEWLGSHIYESLGFPVHETLLGFCEGKVVCACKDFTYPDKELHDFHDVKNSIADEAAGYEGRPSDGSNLFLSDVLTAVNSLPEPYSSLPAMERFWDMFVTDGFIGNADRNNTNWGFLSKGGELLGLAPVFDNGNAFFNKRCDSTIEQRAADERLLEQDAVGASLSCYKDQKGRRISPMKYISEAVDGACMRAVGRFLDRVDMAAIEKLIDYLPEESIGLQVMPAQVKQFHKGVLAKRLEDVYIPAYNQWLANRITLSQNEQDLSQEAPTQGSRALGGIEQHFLENEIDRSQSKDDE